MWTGIAVVVTSVLIPLSPSTTDCSDPAFRQANLSQCNEKHDEWSRGAGGAHGGKGGLLGLGIGGIL